MLLSCQEVHACIQNSKISKVNFSCTGCSNIANFPETRIDQHDKNLCSCKSPLLSNMTGLSDKSYNVNICFFILVVQLLMGFSGIKFARAVGFWSFSVPS